MDPIIDFLGTIILFKNAIYRGELPISQSVTGLPLSGCVNGMQNRRCVIISYRGVGARYELHLEKEETAIILPSVYPLIKQLYLLIRSCSKWKKNPG